MVPEEISRGNHPYPEGSGSDSFFPLDGYPHEVVQTVRLDRYLEESGVGVVDLLKLDIEGSELEALRGLGDRLRDVRAIVGEIHPPVVQPVDLFRLLEANNFRIVRTGPAGRNTIFEAQNQRSF